MLATEVVAPAPEQAAVGSVPLGAVAAVGVGVGAAGTSSARSSCAAPLSSWSSSDASSHASLIR